MDNRVLRLGAMIYGEGGSTDYDTMLKIGSTAINRMNANRPQEFGEGLLGVLYQPNAYYAVQNQNDPYKWAMSGKFPNKDEEYRYKRALQVASGLVSGDIKPEKGMFFFTDKEINRFKKNPKLFNMKAVKEVGKDKNYTYLSY